MPSMQEIVSALYDAGDEGTVLTLGTQVESALNGGLIQDKERRLMLQEFVNEVENQWEAE